MDPTKPPHQLLERQRPPGSDRAPTTSPSRMNGAPTSSCRAVSTTSGRLRVTSESRRVQIDTRSPSRWSWMRAPSYLYSSAEVPAVSREHLAEILGDLGEHRQERHARLHARRRERRGAAAGGERRHRGEIAEPERRAPRASSGAPNAARDRLEHEPVGHPVRSSPTMICWSVSRSSADARAASARSSSSRVRREPAPPAWAMSLNAAATSASVNGAAAAGGCTGGRSFVGRRQPANAQDARVGLRKRAAGQERDGRGPRSRAAARADSPRATPACRAALGSRAAAGRDRRAGRARSFRQIIIRILDLPSAAALLSFHASPPCPLRRDFARGGDRRRKPAWRIRRGRAVGGGGSDR